MNFDLIFGGVGGQGILSIAYVLDNAALELGLRLKQSEVHGMAQRGGAVNSHLRISDQQIFSDMVPLAGAHLLLGVEPLEALRYLEYLQEGGRIVSSTTPEINIPDYPAPERVLAALLAVPGTILLNGKKVAREAGSHRAQNMVVLGAASPYIPLPRGRLEPLIGRLFERKGPKVVEANTRAFRYGRVNGEFFRRCVEVGGDPGLVLMLMDHLESETLEPESAETWCELLRGEVVDSLINQWEGPGRRTLPGSAEVARDLLTHGVTALPA